MADKARVRAGRVMDGDVELRDMSIHALRMRSELGEMILHLLRTSWSDEEGADEARRLYRGQLREVKKALWEKIQKRRKESGWEKPPPRVIEAKVGTMGAKKG